MERVALGQAKARTLMWNVFIAVLKPCELYGDGGSRHVVFLLCGREDCQRTVVAQGLK